MSTPTEMMLTSAANIDRAIADLQCAMDLVYEEIEENAQFIEDQEHAMQVFHKSPRYIDVCLLCFLFYLYGAFFGVYMFPK
jgi:hypothetical protein